MHAPSDVFLLLRRSPDYQVLPSSEQPHSSSPSLSTPWRYLRLAIGASALLCVVAVLSYFGIAQDAISTLRIWVGQVERPPLYESFHESELRLPQHDPDLPFPEGRGGRYVYFKDHSTELGWNNIMQEIMLNALAAYSSNRTFVFYNYQWRDDHTKYSAYNGRLIPSQIPITALLSGPTAGQLMTSDPDFPRSVGVDYFREVCPHPKRWTAEDLEGKLDRNGTAETIISQLSTLLASESCCVEISFQVFHWMVFGSQERMLSVWPRYAASPILTEFRWSPLIEDAFDANRLLIAPANESDPLLSTIPADVLSAARYTPMPGLLALHVRRGDYEAHCTRLANWHATFTAFNAFPAFPDKLAEMVPDTEDGAARVARVRPHCWPSIAEIVARADAVRATPAGAGLRDVYIMTNGERAWVRELQDALRATGRWGRVTSGRDLLLSKEQRYVSQAVDMLIGQRAQAFIGNGWSSMSAQINLLRMASGFRPDSCRHW